MDNDVSTAFFYNGTKLLFNTVVIDNLENANQAIESMDKTIAGYREMCSVLEEKVEILEEKNSILEQHLNLIKLKARRSGK